MAATLTRLRGFIQTYSGDVISNISAVEMDGLKDSIEDMSQILLWEINDDFTNAGDDSHKRQYIVSVVSQLTYLSDGITGFDKDAPEGLPAADFLNWLLFKLAALLEHVQSYFSTYFDFDAELPTHFLDVFKGSAFPIQEELTQNLENHPIDPALCQLITQFANATGRSERFQIKTWRQLDYLQKALKAIAELLNSPLSGDLNLELLKLFISLEFNSIQVYGYFVKYMEKTTLGEASFPEQHQELLYLLKIFRQVRVEASSFYDVRVQSLKATVIESLEAEISYLEQKEKLYLQSLNATNPEAPSKFYFKVAVTLAELMFLFRVMLEAGLITTKFNSYLYEFISNHIQTERAENISKKSMRNHFNNKPFPDRVVQNVKGWLEKMNRHIDLYYKV